MNEQPKVCVIGKDGVKLVDVDGGEIKLLSAPPPPPALIMPPALQAEIKRFGSSRRPRYA